MKADKEIRARERQALGQLIVQLREGKGWSQGELARRAQLNRTWLSRVEHGYMGERRGPNLAMLATVATTLSVSPYLFWEVLGLAEKDLLRTEPARFSREAVEFAEWLEGLPLEKRPDIVQMLTAMRRLAAAEHNGPPAPTPLPHLRVRVATG